MAHEDEELELDEVARRFETVKAHEIREPDSISLTSSRSKSPELDDIKGPFIYYVITFLGFLDPPPPLRKHVFRTENNQILAFSDLPPPLQVIT